MAVYQSLEDNLETHLHTLVETLELEPVASHLIAQEVLTSDRYRDTEAPSQIPKYRNMAIMKFLTEVNKESLSTFISALEETGKKHSALQVMWIVF